MAPDQPVSLSEAFEQTLRDYAGEDDPIADFSLERATELVRADRDGRSST